MKKYIKASKSYSVFEDWTEPYGFIIEKVVDLWGTKDYTQIDKHIETLNSIFRGDRCWDEAYNRWNASEEDEAFVGGN